VKFIDGEGLCKGRRRKQDKVKAKAEKNGQSY
jgi:hypothetical protein